MVLHPETNLRMESLCRRLRFTVPLIVAAFAFPTAVGAAQNEFRPNVVLVMTDDQGYGDLSCHGNPVLQTPALDALHAGSIRLTDFHVDPTCSPTRSALMTGRYSCRTGVWHTIMGRSILRADEVTMPQLFQRAGYATGIFGKWHLGDNYPYRAQDRGFEESLVHGGGGVGQTPDFWGNDYFDDTYWHNGRPEPQEGYCTDVFFAAALNFIEAHRDEPFFAYIPTNAPHGPFLVDEKYSRPFHEKGVPSPQAEFFGMIVNIDENMSRLVRRLDELGLAEDTLLIFMTDNGTAAGYRQVKGKTTGFNAGMRGTKGSAYDGGHRVPCFLRWKGHWRHGRDIDTLAAHIDLLPTLAELCGLERPAGVHWDGQSLLPLLAANGATSGNGPAGGPFGDRTLFVQSHRIEHPEPWRQSAVLTERWRLVDGKELFDVVADPGQKRDVSAEHPDVVAKLRGAYEDYYADSSTRFDEYCRIPLGDPHGNPTTLTCHDWHAPQPQVPWNHQQVSKSPRANGYWAVEVARAGRYRFTLRARPAGIEHPLAAGTAKVRIGEREVSGPIRSGVSHVDLELDLPAGPAMLQTWLDGDGGDSRGAFFVEVLRVN